MLRWLDDAVKNITGNPVNVSNANVNASLAGFLATNNTQFDFLPAVVVGLYGTFGNSNVLELISFSLRSLLLSLIVLSLSVLSSIVLSTLLQKFLSRICVYER